MRCHSLLLHRSVMLKRELHLWVKQSSLREYTKVYRRRRKVLKQMAAVEAEAGELGITY